MIFGQIFDFLDFLEKCQKMRFFAILCIFLCFFVSQVFSGPGGSLRGFGGSLRNLKI